MVYPDHILRQPQPLLRTNAPPADATMTAAMPGATVGMGNSMAFAPPAVYPEGATMPANPGGVSSTPPPMGATPAPSPPPTGAASPPLAVAPSPKKSPAVAEVQAKVRDQGLALKRRGLPSRGALMLQQGRQRQPSRADLGLPPIEVEEAARRARQAAGVTLPDPYARPDRLTPIPSVDDLIAQQMEGMQPGDQKFFNEFGQQYDPAATEVSVGSPNWRFETGYDDRFDWLPFLNVYGLGRDFVEKKQAGEAAPWETVGLLATAAGAPSVARSMFPGNLSKMVRTAGALPNTSSPPYGSRYADAAKRFAGEFVADERGSLMGPRAPGADKSKYRQAQDMAAQGKSRRQIQKETGFFQLPDGMWAAEIPDKAAKITDTIDWVRGNMPRSVALMDVLKHDELFEKYPDFKSMKITFLEGDPDVPTGQYRHSRRGQPASIEINLDDHINRGTGRVNRDKLKRTLLHEITHATQGVEDWAIGSNPLHELSLIVKRLEDPSDIEVRNRLADQLVDFERETGFTFNNLSSSNKQAVVTQAVHNIAEEDYWRRAGEIGAETVANRRNRSPGTLEAKPFWRDYPTPEDEQLFHYRGGETARRGAPATEASMVPTPPRPQMTEPVAGSNKSAADEFASRVKAMGPEYEAVIDVDKGGSVYVRVLRYPLKKDGTRAKGRSGQPVKFKARFSDHGSYWGNNISVDPVSGNTVDDVENVLRYHLTGEGDAPVVGVSSIDPTDGSQLVGTSAYNRDYALNGVNPLSYDPQKMAPSSMVPPAPQSRPLMTEPAPERVTLKDVGYGTDNPGGRWLEGDREYAKERTKPNYHGVGSLTATLGLRKGGAEIRVDTLKDLPGARGEEAFRLTSRKMEELKATVEKEGWNPDAVMVYVDYDGKAYIGEGNHRVALAAARGEEYIPVDIRYFAGGERMDGPLNPQALEAAGVLRVPAKDPDIPEYMASQRPTKTSMVPQQTPAPQMTRPSPPPDSNVAGTAGRYAEIEADVPVRWRGRDLAEMTPQDFKEYGDYHGVPNLGPLTKQVTYKYEDGGTFKIPGGTKGTFTYYDLLQMKADGIDASRIPSKIHTEIQKKLGRTMTPHADDEPTAFNGLLFGITSPNNPLVPNQMAMSRLKPRTMDDIKKLGEMIPWKPGDKVDPKVRARYDRQIAEYFGIQGAPEGGLGVRGNQNYTRVAEMAQMYHKDPDWFVKSSLEDWDDYVERVSSQVVGLGSKTASFGGVWQDPLLAGISAIDRHMAKQFYHRVYRGEGRKAFETKTVNSWNEGLTKRREADKAHKAELAPIQKRYASEVTALEKEAKRAQAALVERGKSETTSFNKQIKDASINPLEEKRLRKAKKKAADLLTVEKKKAREALVRKKKAATKARDKAMKPLKSDYKDNVSALPPSKGKKVRGMGQIMKQSGGEGFFLDRILRDLKSGQPARLTSKGEINTNVSKSLQETNWPFPPEKLATLKQAYRDALKVNQEMAQKDGLGLFNSQWKYWDRVRRRLEPHENMFPGLSRLGSPSKAQLEAVAETYTKSGHKTYAKETEDALDAFGAKLRPTKRYPNPAAGAYFSVPLAAGAAVGAGMLGGYQGDEGPL